LSPLRDIVAWRELALWPSAAQVEQDLLLTHAMAGIFTDDVLRDQLAMRGGTALHKTHLAPAARCSEGIDLVQVGKRPDTHVVKALKRILESVLGRRCNSMVADITLAVCNWVMPSRILRLEYAYRPTTAPRTEARNKIEVNYTERRPCYAVVDLPYALPIPCVPEGPILRSYDIDEMLTPSADPGAARSGTRPVRSVVDLNAECLGQLAAPRRPRPRRCCLLRLYGPREDRRALSGIRSGTGQEADPQDLPQRHARHAESEPAAL
jgi:hypothetical protein